MSSAIVLGASSTEENIGTAIVAQLERAGIVTTGDDCLDPDGVYRIPTLNYDLADYLAVTLGHTRAVPFDEASEDDIAEVIRGSLVLPLMALKAWVQERERGGRAVVIGSYAHDHPLTHSAAYCAAKAGLAAAVRELAWELTEHGFFIHIIHPYHVPSTPMGEAVVRTMVKERGMTREEAEQYQRKDLKMPDHLRADEVADVACWLLLDPAADWLAGNGLKMYGGAR